MAKYFNFSTSDCLVTAESKMRSSERTKQDHSLLCFQPQANILNKMRYHARSMKSLLAVAHTYNAKSPQMCKKELLKGFVNSESRFPTTSVKLLFLFFKCKTGLKS